MVDNHWRASDDLMERIGLDQLIRDTVEQSFERWDGRGAPRGVAGEEILDHLAAGQPRRRGRGLPPARAGSRRRWRWRASGRGRSSTRSWSTPSPRSPRSSSPSSRRPSRGSAVTGAEQASRYWLAHERLDARARGGRRLRRRQVALDDRPLARRRGARRRGGAGHYGMSDGDATRLRRAALVHDLGRLGVPNSIWDKPGPLGPAELERARMHVYLTERMLATSPALAPLAAIAGQHHERLDGSGYPRGLTGGDITPAGRLLAAADSYHARLEPRPAPPRAEPPSRRRPSCAPTSAPGASTPTPRPRSSPPPATAPARSASGPRASPTARSRSSACWRAGCRTRRSRRSW